MKKSIIFILLAILYCSCQSNDKSEYLKEKDAERVASEYLYFSKNGFTLKLTEQEAKEKGISPEYYKVFEERTRLFNENFTKKLDALGNNKLHFFFSLDKVDTTGLDPRLIITDISKGEEIDMGISKKEKQD